MKFEIKSRFDASVLFTADIADDTEPMFQVRVAIKVAMGNGANLSGADLSSADLSGANLRSADLSDANLSSADLIGANLIGANLRSADLSDANLIGANLSSADLSGANLSGANLRGANLSSADLSGANLSGANLIGANLRSADLIGANLIGANLRSADLSSADLSSAIGADLAIAQTRILPEGDLIGWKKLSDGTIAKLRIPAEAKRSHAFGRKCRAQFVEVIEGEGVSSHDGTTKYAPGLRVEAPNWCDDWQQECAGGIHFFITRLEAESY